MSQYQFIHSCVGSTYEDIRALIEDEKQISLRTFRTAIGVRAWKDLTAELGYHRGFPISRDWHVGYYKSTYRGVPAVFLRWSGIEYIFTKNGRVGPSLSRANRYRNPR